jgi:hypothetical protein
LKRAAQQNKTAKTSKTAKEIIYGLRVYRSRQIIRWIPSLMRGTFQLIRKLMERLLS